MGKREREGGVRVRARDRDIGIGGWVGARAREGWGDGLMGEARLRATIDVVGSAKHSAAVLPSRLCRQTDRQTETVRQTDRQTQTQTGRQTDTDIQTHTDRECSHRTTQRETVRTLVHVHAPYASVLY